MERKQQLSLWGSGQRRSGHQLEPPWRRLQTSRGIRPRWRAGLHRKSATNNWRLVKLPNLSTRITAFSGKKNKDNNMGTEGMAQIG